MLSDARDKALENVNEVLKLVKELEGYDNKKSELMGKLAVLNQKHSKELISDFQYDGLLTKALGGRTQTDWLDSYNKQRRYLLGKINGLNSEVYNLITGETASSFVPTDLSSELKKLEFVDVEKKKKRYIKELGLGEREVKKILKKEEKPVKEVYTTYEEHKIGRFASIFDGLSEKLVKRYSDFFNKLFDALKTANFRIFSKTYVNIMLFFSFLLFFVSIVCLSVLFYLLKNNMILIILKTALLSISVFIISFIIFYLYPFSVIGTKRRKINDELPFMVIHMAAVAGSGAQPLTVFRLMLESGEYKELSIELKKIMNYTNLFGYNLSTALRAVAAQTASKGFKELLNGMVAAIESGGSLKDYLKNKADETFTSYKLTRQKYTETLSAYSDIYTGVLIATPLLFIVTLAIIDAIGGQIGGLGVNFLAMTGTFALVPILNIMFLLFLNVVQPKD